MEQKIGFNDLTPALKTLVVLIWILIGFYGLLFIAGMIQGITGAT